MGFYFCLLSFCIRLAFWQAGQTEERKGGLKMTLEQAIKWEQEIARRSETKAKEQFQIPSSVGYITCMKCAEDHRQIAAWLSELKRRRKRDE